MATGEVKGREERGKIQDQEWRSRLQVLENVSLQKKGGGASLGDEVGRQRPIHLLKDAVPGKGEPFREGVRRGQERAAGAQREYSKRCRLPLGKCGSGEPIYESRRARGEQLATQLRSGEKAGGQNRSLNISRKVG